MENNQNTTPNRPKRKQLAPRDMIIVALIVLVMTRINWMQLNSFHVLILFMLFLMLMLRWGNMRKEAVRKQAMERYKEQFEAEAAKKAAEQAAAEPVAAEDILGTLAMGEDFVLEVRKDGKSVDPSLYLSR